MGKEKEIDQEQEKTKVHKDKKKKKEKKEKVEPRGSKKWIVVICLITVLLSLILYLLSGFGVDRQQGLFFGEQKNADLDLRNSGGGYRL